MTALIIGYGNPLRKDDGLGWHVAERLRTVYPAGIDTLVCHQLTPELAEPIAAADLVIFVDARQGHEPGQVTCRPTGPDRAAGPAFSHYLLPEGLLALAEELYGACPPSWVVTVDGKTFGHGADLSPIVAGMVPIVVHRIESLIRAGSQSRR